MIQLENQTTEEQGFATSEQIDNLKDENESLKGKIQNLQDENIEQESEILKLNRELKYVKKMWKRAKEEAMENVSMLDMTQNTEMLIKIVNLEKETEE